MFVLTHKVINDQEITDSNLWKVMVAIADFTNYKTKICFPSLRQIAIKARCDRSTVARVLTILVEKGWIRIIHQKRDDGGDRSNKYQVIKYGDPGELQDETGELRVTTGELGVATRASRVGQPITSNKEPAIEPKQKKKVEAVASPVSLNGDGDLFGSVTKPKKGMPSLEEVKAEAALNGLTEKDAKYIHDCWLQNGFTLRTGKKVDNWKAAIRVWKTNGYFPSQKGFSQEAPAKSDFTPPTKAEVVRYADKKGWINSFGKAAYDWFVAHSWTLYGKPIEDWKSFMGSTMDYDGSKITIK